MEPHYQAYVRDSTILEEKIAILEAQLMDLAQQKKSCSATEDVVRETDDQDLWVCAGPLFIKLPGESVSALLADDKQRAEEEAVAVKAELKRYQEKLHLLRQAVPMK